MTGHIGAITMAYLLQHHALGITVGVAAPCPHNFKVLAERFAAHRTLKLATVEAQLGLLIVTEGQIPY